MNRLLRFLILLTALGLLVACGSPAEEVTEEPAPTAEAAAPTDVPAPTAEPAPTEEMMAIDSVSVPGSWNEEAGCSGDWAPDCADIQLTETGDGRWSGTFVIPEGDWEVKAAINGSWDVNYGADGVSGGANIPFSTPAETEVTFVYDEVSHILEIIVAEPEVAASDLTITEVAAGNPDFSTLVTALQAAGLDEVLAGEGEFTVFAPTNDAFAAIDQDLLQAALADPEGLLTDVLLYHVVDGAVPASAVVGLDFAPTLLEGWNVSVDVVGGNVFVNGTSQVVTTDIVTSNGIIHVIDQVLLPQTVTIYHFGDLSGPLAAITAPLVFGFNDGAAAANEGRGVFGAQIEIQFSDTGGSVDEAVAAYDRFTSEDDNVLLMVTYGSGDAEALATRFVEDQIPNLAAGLSLPAFYGADSGYTFGLGPIYTEQFGGFLDYIVANWDDVKPEGAGDEINLAYISWPTAYGQGALSDQSRAYAESLGVNFVAEELLDVSPTADATTAILNAQAAGANVIYNNTLAFGPATVLNGLGVLGLRGDFLFGTNNWGMDLATFAFLTDPTLANDVYAPFPYLWWTDDNPGIAYAAEVYDSFKTDNDGRLQNVGYLLTFTGVDLAVQAMEQAILNDGWPALSGQTVYEALSTMGTIEANDGVITVDYSDGNRSPQTAQIRRIELTAAGPAFVVEQDFTPLPELREVDQ